jgi:hypothetical protein
LKIISYIISSPHKLKEWILKKTSAVALRGIERSSIPVQLQHCRTDLDRIEFKFNDLNRKLEALFFYQGFAFQKVDDHYVSRETEIPTSANQLQLLFSLLTEPRVESDLMLYGKSTFGLERLPSAITNKYKRIQQLRAVGQGTAKKTKENIEYLPYGLSFLLCSEANSKDLVITDALSGVFLSSSSSSIRDYALSCDNIFCYINRREIGLSRMDFFNNIFSLFLTSLHEAGFMSVVVFGDVSGRAEPIQNTRIHDLGQSFYFLRQGELPGNEIYIRASRLALV